MRRLILPLTLAAASAVVLSGCGNKGPLFFPPPPAPATTVTPQAPHPAAAATPAAASTAPAPASTVQGPARASSTMTPFNPIIHQ
jgi:predicted small lipoprotein YifL